MATGGTFAGLGNWRLHHDYEMYAQFTYSAWFMVFGAILLGAGFWRRSAFLRWQALVLLAVSVGKVFLVDVSESEPGRIAFSASWGSAHCCWASASFISATGSTCAARN